MGAQYVESRAHQDPDFMDTGIRCACCLREVEASEEAAMLIIVYLRSIDGKLEAPPVLDPEDGDYQFAPLFIHLEGCWKDVDGGLKEKIADLPPIETDAALLRCQFCSSGICEWEYFCWAQFGEFYCSPQMPNKNRPVYYFKPWGTYDETNQRICLSCIVHIGEDTLDEWKDITQDGECGYCIHARCWRDSTCSCYCHE